MSEPMELEQRNARALARKTLKDHRTRSGVSQADVARAMGVNRATIHGFISGDRNMTLNSFSGMLYQMGYRITDIVVEKIENEDQTKTEESKN